MDEQDIYANVEGPSGTHVKWRRVKSSENIYQNEDTCCSVETDRTGPALSALQESNTVRNCSYRASTVFLGVLCLLLLVGLITVFVLYNERSSKCEMKRIQLKTSYKNLTKEKDQLQTSYNNLTKEKDQFHKQIEEITTELQRMLEALHSQEWKYFSHSLYYFSSTMKSWQESRNDCLQKESDLVIINSPEEQEFIRSWKKRAWIGLTDAETEGTWKWVDGTLLGSQRYWVKSEPNNEGNEDCGEIRKFDSQNSWNDVMCNLKNHWICETKLSSHLKLTGQK
ncbi:CD209 antigen-like protein C [Betta splendens]|uniref:CD209 antigen-like protein C n=1 Tax=Betta splendens TaxID=158456 RepID=A0A6P7NPG9_BETSP|nr:CD209 antigen-like protein C [Betta splendens]